MSARPPAHAASLRRDRDVADGKVDPRALTILPPGPANPSSALPLSAFEPEKIMESTSPATVSTPPMMAHDLESTC